MFGKKKTGLLIFFEDVSSLIQKTCSVVRANAGNPKYLTQSWWRQSQKRSDLSPWVADVQLSPVPMSRLSCVTTCICRRAVRFPLYKGQRTPLCFDSIHNITELMPCCFNLGVDQSMSKGLVWFEDDSIFLVLKQSFEFFDRPATYGINTFFNLSLSASNGSLWHLLDNLLKVQFSLPHVWSRDLMCVTSFYFPSVLEGTLWAQSFSVRITPILCSSGGS